MYLYTAFVALFARLMHAAPTGNITLSNLNNATLSDTANTAIIDSDPAWAAGTCKVKINLRQECIYDFNKHHYVTTWAAFEITDNNGSPIHNLWGRGIGEEYPANEIDLAHIQGPSFQFHWKWEQSKTDDAMSFGYDWDDDEHGEGDFECEDGKVWSESSGGWASTWWYGCVKRHNVKPGSNRTRHTTCPFHCSYKHKG